jgi:hypothetical protein
MTTVDLKSVRIFLNCFRPESNLPKCKVFLRKASAIGQRLQHLSLKVRNEKAPDFNVFAITKRGHYEVTTHSRLLGALLDPIGSHEQGNLFLAAFLDLLMAKKPNWVFPKPDHRWSISLENDSIDIVLSHPNPQNPQTRIIIENKWSAPDREQQLFAYWRRQRELTGLKSIPAIYLTPSGRRPKECSSVKNSEFFRDLVTISYVQDIMALLIYGLSEVKSARVRETVFQYVQLIENIDENR